MNDSLGIYISIPFCKAKCTYCNFASGVFSAERMERYVQRLCAEIASAQTRASAFAGELPQRVDSIYFGGGTPSLLSADQTQRIFNALCKAFEVVRHAEITIECAPGQLTDSTLDALLRQGMNRVSFGVQSFVDAEARATGRLHTRAICLAEIERLRAAGVENLNVDLIAGLPHQTTASWRESVEVALASQVPHLSLYMLEVDEDSRLGRELLADGSRYSATAVSSEDETAERYALACQWLHAAGIEQYEISNFARIGRESRHNLKYWQREPYLGFGLDAHSMLRGAVQSGHSAECNAVRWANPEDLETYFAEPQVERISQRQAFEESIFLGLRLNRGIDLRRLQTEFGEALLLSALAALPEIEEAGLLLREGDLLRLTARGRMASNEVFSRLLSPIKTSADG
ncbi:MAG: radical SAM family heme chaperone HemW [Acidobacteriaceae bacterium]|nr:radical SAM family heme chaperone HemW [Acidobacteriaceae bacterium]